MQNQPPSPEELRKLLQEIQKARADASPAAPDNPRWRILHSFPSPRRRPRLLRNRNWLNWLNSPFRITVPRWAVGACVFCVLFLLILSRVSLPSNQSQVTQPDTSPQTNNQQPIVTAVTPTPTDTPVPTDTPTPLPPTPIPTPTIQQTYMIINMTDACQWEYSRSDLTAKQNVPGAPNTWECYDTEQGIDVGGIPDLDRYCATQGWKSVLVVKGTWECYAY